MSYTDDAVSVSDVFSLCSMVHRAPNEDIISRHPKIAIRPCALLLHVSKAQASYDQRSNGIHVTVHYILRHS